MDTVARIFELADKIYPEQQAFAAAIGVSAKTVSVWRTGRGKSYTKYLQQIADALNTSVEYLLTGKTQNSPPPEGDELSEKIRLKVSLLRDDVKLELDHYIDYLLARQDDP